MQELTISAMDTNWSAVALRDLDAVYKTIHGAHPAVLDESDIAFHAWFKEGYVQARKLAEKARTEQQAYAAVRYYTTGFMDGHLLVFRKKRDHPAHWAGWLMQKRGDDFFVTDHANHWPVPLPPIGAKVLACDGQSVSNLIREKIAPYFDQRLHLLGTWSRLARAVTIDSPDTPLWEPLRIKRCTVELAGQSQKSYPLAWREHGKSTEDIFPRQRFRQQVKDLGNGIHWIHVSNFQPNKAESEALEEILEQIGQLHQAKTVVLDTRGNGGGNSLIGHRILRALLKDRMPADAATERAYLRVSSLAINRMEEHVAHFSRTSGASSSIVEYADLLLKQLRIAYAQKLDWIEQDPLNHTEEIEKEYPPFKGRLALITDTYCASSCLNFVDIALRVPGVVHMGLPTSADTNYLEVAQISLPSGLKMWVPLKVWRNRSRESNHPHVPRFVYDGDIRDTQALQDWALKIIAREE